MDRVVTASRRHHSIYTKVTAPTRGSGDPTGYRVLSASGSCPSQREGPSSLLWVPWRLPGLSLAPQASLGTFTHTAHYWAIAAQEDLRRGVQRQSWEGQALQRHCRGSHCRLLPSFCLPRVGVQFTNALPDPALKTTGQQQERGAAGPAGQKAHMPRAGEGAGRLLGGAREQLWAGGGSCQPLMPAWESQWQASPSRSKLSEESGNGCKQSQHGN